MVVAAGPARRLGRRVVVGVSGGVDSSVAALLLKRAQQFDEVVGVFMRNWEPADEAGDSYTCPLTQDLKDATRVCSEIGIPLHKVDFVKEYWNEVFEPYVEGFGRGGTPNPDVFCNREIKFKSFRRFVEREFGAETHLATGHYARLRHAPPGSAAPPQLLRGLDPGKDQSYFLSAVPGDAMRQVHFPVGELLKPRVRQIARDAGLTTATKKDSVGICFVGKRRFPEFISEFLDPLPGRFVDWEGNDMGPHGGVHLFTVGQGASIGGLSTRHYVAAKNVATREVVVVPGADHPALRFASLRVSPDRMFWVAGEAPAPLLTGAGELRCHAVVRYRNRGAPCTVRLGPDGCVEILFDEPESTVVCKQIVALYDGDVCLGGGVIDEAHALEPWQGALSSSASS